MLPFTPPCPIPPLRNKCGGEDLQVDEVVIEIEGVVMKMVRRSTLKVPAEVSAIIPRVEIRRRTFENGQLKAECEMILNSITIVHAPRHPQAGENPPEQGEGQGGGVKDKIEKHITGNVGATSEAVPEVKPETAEEVIDMESKKARQGPFAGAKAGAFTEKPVSSLSLDKALPEPVIVINGCVV